MSEQLDLLEGARLRRIGLDRVEDSAQAWLAWIRKEARAISRIHGQVTSDDLRQRADEEGHQPHHQNAWGAVFRGSEWELVGYTKSKYRTNHARRISIWRLKK